MASWVCVAQQPDSKTEVTPVAKQEIELFVAQLPSTPGWVGMNQSDREWLQQETSSALTLYRESGLKAIQFCIKLDSIQQFLEGKTMNFTNWVRTCFGSSERTAYRWLSAYKEMRGAVPDQALLYLAQEGLAGVNNTLQPRELLPVLKALPAPKGGDRKTLEGWSEKVSQELRQRRSKRRKRVSLTLKEEDALRVFVITARRLMREAKLESSAEQRAWLKRGVGYIMQLRAISGTVTTERTSIPEGFMPQVGRPRKSPPEGK